jgi:hypothetical protein
MFYLRVNSVYGLSTQNFLHFSYIIYLTNINIRWYIYINSGVTKLSSLSAHHATSKSKSNFFSRKINKIRME